MLGMEEILCELEREDINEQGLPPGFRFHPTDEELITFYLASKVFNGSFSGVQIAEVDLNRCEPWQLPDVAKMGEREWYFFSLRDRKYPTGLRTNRATGAGYWKATGKDREVYSASSGALLGMKKTLVFYKGRAPRGEKTKWVMHEYRLEGDFSCRHTSKEEWVICRIIHKTGEKKIQAMHQHHSYLIKASTFSYNTGSGSGSLPPLLEPPPPPPIQNLSQLQTQNPFLIQTQESDLKSLINPIVAQCDIFPYQEDPSILFKPFLPQQDLTLKELNNVVAKQCKKEVIFSPHDFQLLDGFVSNMQWAERIQENIKYHNPLVFGLDNCGLVIPSEGGNAGARDTAAIDHLMSTEPAALRWW